MEMKLTPSDPVIKNVVPIMEPERRDRMLGVPDLYLPVLSDRVLVQRTKFIQHTNTARWTGTEWIFLVVYQDNTMAWIKETPEEGTYEELEDQPSEEPNQAVSRSTGPISG